MENCFSEENAVELNEIMSKKLTKKFEEPHERIT